MLALTEKQVLATGAPQQRNPAKRRVSGHSRGDAVDDDVAMAEVYPAVDADLESLHRAGREKGETLSKALMYQIILAHTRPTKVSDGAFTITLSTD